jgi:hypothetical protein
LKYLKVLLHGQKNKLNAEIERIKTNPTKADLLKDFVNFLGNESSNLQNYASEFSYFTHQQAWNFANDGPVGRAAEKLKPAAGKSLLRRHPSHPPSLESFTAGGQKTLRAYFRGLYRSNHP